MCDDMPEIILELSVEAAVVTSLQGSIVAWVTHVFHQEFVIQGTGSPGGEYDHI